MRGRSTPTAPRVRSIMNEELAAHAARALAHMTHWAPAVAGLHLRSLVEKKFPRLASRALQQLEVRCVARDGRHGGALADPVLVPQPPRGRLPQLMVAQCTAAAPPAVPRLQGCFTVLYPLQAEVELTLAEVSTRAASAVLRRS